MDAGETIFDNQPGDRQLTILYATETGTGEQVANRIARHCRHFRFTCAVFNVEDYSVEDIVDERLVVFVVSTAGSGKEPRPMIPLWTMLLRASLPEDLFEDMRYAVFGLGDSSYDRFCWPAKKLSRRIEMLGATPVCDRGEGDVQHPLGTDGALDPWLAKLTQRLTELYPLPGDESPGPIPELWPARVALSKCTSNISKPSDDPLLDAPGYHTFTLKSISRITAEGWFQDVRHCVLDCDEDITYNPGDVAVIHPEVDATDVDSVLASQGWTADAGDLLTVHHLHKDQTLPLFLPITLSLRTILTRYVDITAVPKRDFFAIVRHFTDDEREREKMDDFTSAEGAEDLYDYTFRVRRSAVEVLEDFPHVKIPKEYVFDVFPPLRPREFSIASSVQVHPRQIQLCIAIVNYKTKLRRPRRGVATSFLSRLSLGSQLRIRIKPGLLELPTDPSTPVICVGPGTGIAPMRALIETRVHDGSRNNTLYFGCRSASKDQHYADQWKRYVEEQSLDYRLAPSRDGEEGIKRTYVQDLVKEDSKRIWESIHERDGIVYISGSSNKMPTAVRKAIADAAVEWGKLDESQANAYVLRMEKEGRLYEECWS